MRKLSLKSLLQKSRRIRNEQVIKDIAQRDDNGRNWAFYGHPLKVVIEKKKMEWSIGKFFGLIASNF